MPYFGKKVIGNDKNFHLQIPIYIYLYIYFRNVRSPCLDPWIRPLQNALADPAHRCAIPHWNRLSKIN